MSVNDDLKNLVAGSSGEVLSAISLAPDDYAFVSVRDGSGKTAADYALLVANDKAMIATGLGSQTVPPVPTLLNTKAEAQSSISDQETNLEDQIERVSPWDFEENPASMGYPIDCNLPTYYDCVVAHSQRDRDRAAAIRSIFGQ